MNLGTIGALLGVIASLTAILAYFDNGIQKNKARLRAEKGRVISLEKILRIQGERISALERHASTMSSDKNGFGDFQCNEPLIELEQEAREEYKRHQTDLT